MSKPQQKDGLIEELRRLCPRASRGGCKRQARGKGQSAAWCVACRAAQSMEARHKCLVGNYETIKRLNRRCQRAEAVAEPRAYSDQGKRIAKYMYVDLLAARQELAKVKAELLAIERSAFMAAEESAARRSKRMKNAVRGVYFIQYGNFVKIGLSGDVSKRLEHFDRTLMPEPPQPLGYMPVDGGDWELFECERALHQRFSHLRHRGEWFRDSIELRDFIAEACASWPMAVAS